MKSLIPHLVAPVCLVYCLNAAAMEPVLKERRIGHAAPTPPPLVVTDTSSASATEDGVIGTKAVGGLTLYSIGNPTDEEQLYVEFINRARKDPIGEAERFRSTTDVDVLNEYKYFDVDLALFDAQMIVIAPAPPLALSAELTEAARRHSQDMLDNAFQGHTGSDGTAPADRVTEAGFQWTAVGENVFSYAESPWHGHGAFEVDWGGDASTGGMQQPPGHRITIHDPVFKEVGVGVIHGTNGPVGPRLVAQEFGRRRNGTPRITGVAFYDLNGNEFYDIGEGIEGVTVTAQGSSFYAVTAGSGGYTIPVPGNGSYSVTFSVPGLDPVNQTVVISNQDNSKIDFTPVYGPPKISGPTRTPLNQSSTFTFSAVPGTKLYQWKKSRRVPGTVVDGAENGLSGMIATTSAGYDVIDSNVKARGSFSFHLAHAEREDQFLELDWLFRPGPGAELTFLSRLGYASTGQIARAQVSTDDGLNWQDVWTQPGTDGPGETSFSARAVSLSSYAGQELRIRFVYEMPNGQYFPTADRGIGFYIDDIAVNGAEELVDISVQDVSTGNAFTFTPSVTGDYTLSVRAKVGNEFLPWGPAKLVGTDAVEATEVTITGIQAVIGNQLQITFESSGGAGNFALETAPTINGPWNDEAGASVQPVDANRYRVSVARPSANAGFYRISIR